MLMRPFGVAPAALSRRLACKLLPVRSCLARHSNETHRQARPGEDAGFHRSVDSLPNPPRDPRPNLARRHKIAGALRLIENEQSARLEGQSGERAGPNREGLVASLADHHIRGLDDRECIVTDPEAEIVDGLVGDRRGDDDSAADVNTDLQLSDPSLL